jgi:hypothetical protein
MALKPSKGDENSLVQQHINTSYDVVKLVSDNIGSVIIAAGSIVNVNIVANDIANVNAVGTDIVNVNTVATNIVNVNIVATDIANVNLVGTDIINVNTVATNIINVNTVATDIANVNTTAGSIASVNTVAGSITNVNTVATDIANVNTVAADILAGKIDAAIAAAISTANDLTAVQTIYDNFDDRYLGQFASDPTLDNDGNALLIGAIYFNTTVDEVKFYNGGAWESPEAISVQAAADAVAAKDAAELALDQFTDIYLGPKAIAPTLDNDGGPLAAGMIYWDTVLSKLFIYDGSAWSKTGVSTTSTFRYTATAEQTIFTGLDINNQTLNYTPGFIIVGVNGSWLDASEVTAVDGLSITLPAVSLGGQVQILAFGTIDIVNAYTKAESDAKMLGLATTATGTVLTLSDIQTLISNNLKIGAPTDQASPVPGDINAERIFINGVEVSAGGGIASTKDWGSVSIGTTINLEDADMHVIEVTASITLTFACAIAAHKATIAIHNTNSSTITVAGINNNSPTLTVGTNVQDIVGLLKSHGKITTVGLMDNVSAV